MIRALALAAILTFAAPAAAQTGTGDGDARATRAISFLWRPVAALTAENVNAACSGAEAEIEAAESALPPVLTPESLARVRTLRGLLVIPTDEPANPYFFPDRSLTWFASGLGAVHVLNEAEGFVGVRDASGQQLAFQLGSAGGKPILRIREPQGSILNFVGCAPTLPAS